MTRPTPRQPTGALRGLRILTRRATRRAPLAAATACACLLPFLASAPALTRDVPADDRRIADKLAAMLRAGRTVISESQDLINTPAAGRKRLDGNAVLARAVAIFQRETGLDPRSFDSRTREGRLVGLEMAAIRDVVEANQASINTPDLGFKGFIPAVFSRLVSEAFSRKAAGLAEMKVTAPRDLVRYRKSLPDTWEAAVIDEHLLRSDWPKGQPYQATLREGERSAFRIAVPEYYTASCLSCHGGPKGALDITNYPKEGAGLGALGGVISIKLFKP